MKASLSFAELVEVQQWVYAEARLLDEWRLEEWLELFESDGHYVVPATDAHNIRDDAQAASDRLDLILDDRDLVAHRIARLLNARAHAEHPRSIVRHLVTNIEVLDKKEKEISVASNLLVSRWRRNHLDLYPGHCFQRLRERDSDGQQHFGIVERRVTLDMESLDPVGPLSFLL